jgi:hypothetical protein
VTLHTHSPLTIGAGGISAGNGVTLTAGDGSSLTDALVLNGSILTTLGNMTFGGHSVAANAPVFGPNAPVFNSQTPVAFSPNYSANPVPVVVTPPTTPPIVVTTTTVDQNVVSTSNNVDNVTDSTTPVTTTQTNTLNNTSNQTAGGGDGEFGGSKDDGKGKDEKSNKPAPMCT